MAGGSPKSGMVYRTELTAARKTGSCVWLSQITSRKGVIQHDGIRLPKPHHLDLFDGRGSGLCAVLVDAEHRTVQNASHGKTLLYR